MVKMKYKIFTTKLEPESEDTLNRLVKGGKIVYVEKAEQLIQTAKPKKDSFWDTDKHHTKIIETIYKILVGYEE